MNIYILNTLGSGMDIISLLDKDINITGVIGLGKRKKDDKISDYIYQNQFCKDKKIPFIELKTYNISNREDKSKLNKLDIDILIICGWQRLIPNWLIKKCNIYPIGIHGSPLGITKGRGRSPQNWGIILGLENFYISIFKIENGVDSGEIIDTKHFKYSPYDTIKTSYYKISVLSAQMIIKNIKNKNFYSSNFIKQNHTEAQYFPQRLPEDGVIDWNRSEKDIRNFIRALTKPYPGALTFIDNNIIKIWSILPFDIQMEGNYEVGEIIKIFNKNDILIKTKESLMLIDEYEIITPDLIIKEGMKFTSVSYHNQTEKIINRHLKKYPNLPISSTLINHYDQSF